jgi:hypothetical protein
MPTIFVSIASYRDPELTRTVKSMLENADRPQDLRITVVAQDKKDEFQDLSFVGPYLTYVKMDYSDALGPCYARKVAMQCYQNEDYFLQLDSHIQFVKHWDTKLMNIYNQAKEVCDKPIITHYPPGFEVTKSGTIKFDEKQKDTEALKVIADNVKVLRGWRDGWHGTRDKPLESKIIAAGFLFGPGNIVKELPYDERIFFVGEEITYSLRAYSRGYKFFAPQEPICYHFNGRHGYPKFWTRGDEIRRPVRWSQLERSSRAVIHKILTGIEKGTYGIADEKLAENYQKFIGIDFKEHYAKGGK